MRVQTLLSAVAGLSAIAIAVSGCTGDSGAEAESPPATTTGQVETQPPATSTGQVETQPSNQSAVNISKLRAAFKETYGEQPWYGQIAGMKVTGNRTIEITMKVDGSEIDVGTLCEAAFNAADDAGVGDAIEAVHLIGSDGSEGGCA